MDGNEIRPDRQQVLRYLGYRGQEISSDLDGQLEEALDRLARCAEPRTLVRRLKRVSGGSFGLPLPGRDLTALLTDCEEILLMAATLGPGPERELRKLAVSDLTEAVILDACASAAIEKICDRLEEKLAGKLQAEGLWLTDRFSPGYGDLPLTVQRDWCAVLDTARRIGLTVTEQNILIPVKSVTAVMGISRLPQKRSRRGCRFCGRSGNCLYRKEGRSCDA